MPVRPRFSPLALVLSVACSLTVCSLAAVSPLAAQSTMAPINDRPNPYRTVEGWAKLPDGRTWGSTSAVDVDRDGRSIWVAERCGANNCVNSALPSILKFDANGTLVKSFGAGLLISPHGIHVDAVGNIWVTDCACTAPAPPAGGASSVKRGHQVLKFSPEGSLLMTLGTPGGTRDTGYFWMPNGVITGRNGDIYVAEGHSSRAGANARILKFDRTGKLLRTWGSFGHGPTELDQPHSLALDSRGRLFVADRSNNRILILDQDFNLVDTWYQFSRPSGLYIDRNDVLYVADSESGSVSPPHVAWTRGIRIGSVRDGKVVAFIPDPETNTTNTSSAEGIAVDAAGNIYGAEVGQRALKRYERKSSAPR